MKVEGKGTIAIKTSQGNIKLLNDVQYVPGLAHNLLSVGQLLNASYSPLFDDDCCSVYDKKSGHSIVRIPMAQNQLFPVEVSGVKDCVVVAKICYANLWHLQYGHLTTRGLELLGEKNMVVALLGCQKLVVLSSVNGVYMANIPETHSQ